MERRKKPQVNREYKDVLFKFIFGSEERKQYALSLYNALNGTNLSDPEMLKIVTLEDVIYLNYKNDVAVLVDSTLSMWEQQSTRNPNMGYRFLQYTAQEMENYVNLNDLYPYGSSKISLPVPKCIVLYNGSEEEPSEEMIRLSDLFPEGSQSSVEVSVMVYNIYTSSGSGLLSLCKPLLEYAWITDTVRFHLKNMGIRSSDLHLAFDRMLEEMPDEYELKPLIKAERARVISMLDTEFDAEKFRRHTIAEGRAEGIALGMEEGMAKGMAKGMAEGMATGIIKGMVLALKPMFHTAEEIHKQIISTTGMTDITIDDIERYLKETTEEK